MRKLYFAGVFSLLMLAACATAVSRTPQIDRGELEAEQKEQEAIVRQTGKKDVSAGKTNNRQEMLARLEKVGTPIAKAGRVICAELRGNSSPCTFPFALDKDSETDVNAYTDGAKIVVSPAMMHFSDSDDQLAVVLSHEYAHAIMKHPAKTQQNASMGGLLGMAADMLAQSQGINTGGALGQFAQQTAVMRYSQSFEREADYIGLYLMARADYPVEEAAKLWRNMARVNPEGVYNSSSHPTSAERYLLLKKTSAEIKQKQAAGQPLLPERLPEE
jgi:predicted Zn-dependent protease